MKLACTLGELVKLIVSIKPEWQKHLKIDANGQLDAINKFPDHNRKPIIHGMSLVIPRTAELGFNYSDIGFQKQADGTWRIHYDDLPYGFNNPEAQLKAAAAARRAKRIATKRGGTVVKDTVAGGKRTIRIRVPLTPSVPEAERMTF